MVASYSLHSGSATTFSLKGNHSDLQLWTFAVTDYILSSGDEQSSQAKDRMLFLFSALHLQKACAAFNDAQ